MLFTDTDSFMYVIKTKAVDEDFSKDKEMFDFSNFWANSKYYDNWNKLVVGKIEDETGGVAVKKCWMKDKLVIFLGRW